MLRINDLDIEQRPRKRVKLDTVNTEEYNEFKGEAIQQIYNSIPSNYIIQQQQINVNDQIKAYTQIYQFIIKNPRANRKMHGKQFQLQNHQRKQPDTIKKQQTQQEAKNKLAQVKNQKKKNIEVISSNWKQFLIGKQTNQHKKKQYQFVAIDCQFVKSYEQQCLARVSLVNQHGQELYDSYVKPNKKITDFVTQISGITFSHIKNAPPEAQVIAEIKKKILNKIVVGHTTQKDLEICGLKNWTGIKKIIDIADAQVYSPGGKRVALKKLANNYLGKTIQQGWHSSIEDANATMQLFLKYKNEILKQKKIVKI